MRRSTALAPGIAATLLAGVVTVALRAGGEPSPSVGHLAFLLAHHHAHAIARAVAPESRPTLSAGRLQATWDAITGMTGPMQGTPTTIVVHEAGGATDEIELVQFGDRHVATLAARREGRSITGLVMLAGTTNPAAAAAGAQCALDLVGGRLADVVARFDSQMSSLLPLSRLGFQTAEATGGLRGPAHVAAQVIAQDGSYTVVETYLVFANGIRRIQTTFGADGKIAGLYTRLL